MQINMATSAGTAGRPNEDFAGAVPGAVVLLDGAGIPEATPEYEQIRATCVEAMRARRNRPGGYWIAKDDPLAAYEAVTGSRPLDELDGAALLSNGASRIVHPYGLTDWSGLIEVLHADGPDGIIRRVRQAEAGDPGAGAPDDATVVHCTHLPR